MTSPVTDHWPETSLLLMWLLTSARDVKISPWAILTGEDIMILETCAVC